MTGRIASETVGRGSGEDDMTYLGKSVLNAEPGVPAARSVDGLIARLESASEGSRNLDWDVAVYLGVHVVFKRGTKEMSEQFPFCVHGPGGVDSLAAFTTSLDAALTLVPEGAVWHVMTDYGGLNRAKIGPTGRPSASICHPRKRAEIFIQADAETPALALCIAALKARQTTPQPERVSDRSASNTEAAQVTPSGTPIAGGGR